MTMKKLIAFFVAMCAAALLFADYDSDKRQVLALFAGNQAAGTHPASYESMSVGYVKCDAEDFRVWDSAGKVYTVSFMRGKKKGSDNINVLLEGSNISKRLIWARCEASQKRYPVPEFVEQFAAMNSRANP